MMRYIEEKGFGFDGQRSQWNSRAKSSIFLPLLAPGHDEKLCKHCRSIDFEAIFDTSRAISGKVLPVQAEIWK